MSLSLNIRKRYPGFALNVRLEAGEERVALLGASGCGKSCTLRCIAGVETPDEGRIVVNGVTFFDAERGVNLTPQQRKTALLFQNYQLFPNLTVEENVCAGMDRRLSAQQRRAQARAFLRIFGMERYAQRYPARLSGGQQQRVALARMIAARPGIFMFDEPFSALDAHLKGALEQNLLDIFDVVRATVLYVSHDIDEALRFCQRICVLDAGHVAQVGTIDEIVNAPATLATLRLTGCKNISRAAYVDDHHVRALDWGMTFAMARPVPRTVTHLGIRASYIHRDARQGENSFTLRVGRTSDSRFERVVLLDAPAGNGRRLQWKVSRVDVPEAQMPHMGDVLTLHFDASRIYLITE